MRMVFISFCLFLVIPALARDIQQSECLPNSAEAANWPVATIYLHGLLPSRGRNSINFDILEANNRRELEAAAKRLKIRIAVPVSQSISRNGDRQWNPYGLKEIESFAKDACGGAPLAPNRALLGFSNGGYAARKVGLLPCPQTKAYGKIFAIGAPTKGRKSDQCDGQLENTDKHEFPKASVLVSMLGYLSRSSGSVESPSSSDATGTVDDKILIPQ